MLNYHILILFFGNHFTVMLLKFSAILKWIIYKIVRLSAGKFKHRFKGSTFRKMLLDEIIKIATNVPM